MCSLCYDQRGAVGYDKVFDVSVSFAAWGMVADTVAILFRQGPNNETYFAVPTQRARDHALTGAVAVDYTNVACCAALGQPRHLCYRYVSNE